MTETKPKQMRRRRSPPPGHRSTIGHPSIHEAIRTKGAEVEDAMTAQAADQPLLSMYRMRIVDDAIADGKFSPDFKFNLVELVRNALAPAPSTNKRSRTAGLKADQSTAPVAASLPDWPQSALPELTPEQLAVVDGALTLGSMKQAGASIVEILRMAKAIKQSTNNPKATKNSAAHFARLGRQACPASAPLRQTGVVEERRISGSS